VRLGSTPPSGAYDSRLIGLRLIGHFRFGSMSRFAGIHRNMRTPVERPSETARHRTALPCGLPSAGCNATPQ
jgi:hypothetical protein